MGVPGFWEFASKTVVKSAQGPARDRPAVAWASGSPPAGGGDRCLAPGRPFPAALPAGGGGKEVRQSSSLDTEGGGERLEGSCGRGQGSGRRGVDSGHLRCQEAGS